MLLDYRILHGAAAWRDTAPGTRSGNAHAAVTVATAAISTGSPAPARRLARLLGVITDPIRIATTPNNLAALRTAPRMAIAAERTGVSARPRPATPYWVTECRPG